ncbi:hypothetical protein AB0D04_26140 [Streptomyces sp. NPDC048483]|uniref:hypothetical protein n=1 Tax=Streptomyces sp. NPDC048483 TaxID=3154927 RepID=UPI003443E816
MAELFEITDEHGSGQRLTVFTASWDGDPACLRLNEGTELRFVSPAELGDLTIPPFNRDVLARAASA